MKLVTTPQAARHLRLDDLGDSDIAADLEDKCLQASALIIDFLKYPIVPPGWVDTSGEPIGVPYHVQAATLIWLGILWKHRDGESDETLQDGYIPKTVSNLLTRSRDPAYA